MIHIRINSHTHREACGGRLQTYYTPTVHNLKGSLPEQPDLRPSAVLREREGGEAFLMDGPDSVIIAAAAAATKQQQQQQLHRIEANGSFVSGFRSGGSRGGERTHSFANRGKQRDSSILPAASASVYLC